ncbi:MAG: hypothetical protein WD768_14810 [Phycisphaeraceae bacterium]
MFHPFPEPFEAAIGPLLEALPLDEAMSQLVVREEGPTGVVQRLVQSPVFAAHAPLQAGLWLYVDRLDRSHEISQAMDDATGSFWHAIMHRREGDFGNSHYWFRRAGNHPAMKLMEDYDAHAFIDAVEVAHRKGAADEELIQMQRGEWFVLMRWCMEQAK